MVTHTTLVDAIQELYQSPLFRTLPAGAVQKILAAALMRTCSGGEILVREGEPGDSMLIIIKGWAVLTHKTPSGREVQLGRVGPGDVLGEMSLIEPGPRSATATVLTPMVLYELETDSFNRMIDSGEDVALQLLRRLSLVLSGRLRAVDRKIHAELTEGEPSDKAPFVEDEEESPESAGSEKESERHKVQRSAPPPSNPLLVEAPRFEMARQRGIWKILFGLRD